MNVHTGAPVAQPHRINHPVAEGLQGHSPEVRGSHVECRALDTLETSRVNRPFQPIEADSDFDLSIREGEGKYQKRAKRKHIIKPIVTALTEYAKQSDSHLEKAYRNSIYCADLVLQEDGKLSSHYCKRRHCIVCESIRTAKLINTYKPVLETWGCTHFATLTQRTVKAERLVQRIDSLISESCETTKTARKRGIEYKAVRKLEITYNSRTKLYHPHLHLLFSNEDAATYTVDRHLDRHRESANKDAQDIRKADNQSLVEVFKYATKFVTKAKDSKGLPVPVSALDMIFRSLHRRRTVQPIGFKIAGDPEALDDLRGGQAFKSPERDIQWQWIQACADWIDLSTGEALSGYIPAE